MKPASNSIPKPELALRHAQHLLSEGSLAEAASTLAEACADEPSDFPCLTLLARIRAAQGYFSEAALLLDRAELLRPGHPKVDYFRGEILEQQGRFDDALVHRRRLALDSTEPSGDHAAQFLKTISGSRLANTAQGAAEATRALGRLALAPGSPAKTLSAAARSLYSISSMETRARQLHDQVDPCADDSQDVELRWQKFRPWCEGHGARLHILPTAGKPGRRPQVAELGSAHVTDQFQFVPLVGSLSVALEGVANRNLRLRSEGVSTALLLNNSRTCLLRLARSRRQIDAPCALIGGTGSYYHDLIEHIGTLAAFESMDCIGDRTLAVNSAPAPFQLELLALLGYDACRLARIPTGVPVGFKDLSAGCTLAFGGQWIDPILPQWYRQRLSVACENPSRKLYLSRRRATVRRVLNEADVEQVFKRFGYEVLAPEVLSVRDQIAIFSQASHIAGPTGAALTNMLFAPVGARITVLITKWLTQARAALHFQSLATACGHALTHVECAPARMTSERVLDADILVDLASLEEALERADSTSTLVNLPTGAAA